MVKMTLEGYKGNELLYVPVRHKNIFGGYKKTKEKPIDVEVELAIAEQEFANLLANRGSRKERVRLQKEINKLTSIVYTNVPSLKNEEQELEEPKCMAYYIIDSSHHV